ncbi:hypothetical protein L596_022523 [Steinernema carpocapsae]|uniref:F-box domain-containing protein n=1 Tax=Steinernema carpocapsae TaxID=34508 RepID=A0A4U5MM21_STECR|nr:hypothetical protein L596_022523 [Steinernema carpocapsae]
METASILPANSFLPDDVLIRIVQFLDFRSCLSLRIASKRFLALCGKYGQKELLVLDHSKGEDLRDPTAPRRVILSFEDGSEFDRVLEGDQFGKAAKNYEDLDKLLSKMPRDLFRITEVTTSLSVILRLQKRFLLRDFTLDQLCQLGSKHKHLFDVRRICIDNGDLTDDHQFQKFQQLISVFANPGTDLRLFLSVGNRLKEVFDVMKAKKLSSKLLLLNAETVEDVKLIQALLLSETSVILSDFLHLQMNIVEQVEKVTFVEFMDNFVKKENCSSTHFPFNFR